MRKLAAKHSLVERTFCDPCPDIVFFSLFSCSHIWEVDSASCFVCRDGFILCVLRVLSGWFHFNMLK